MKTITTQKEFDEIKTFLEGSKKIYLIGCGTCATLCKTGGREEVVKMKEKLEQEEFEVIGWMIIPTACDTLTSSAIEQEKDKIDSSDALLCLTCAYGLQMVGNCIEKPVYPALNTLFVGLEEGEEFKDVCIQCGECMLGLTSGICPITACSKGLLNGPCGGSLSGKCEVSSEIDCGWQLIIEKLKKLNRLQILRKVAPAKDWSKSLAGGPRKIKL